MKAKVLALIFLGSVVCVRADQMIESVQQALKDQGFYYGEITGEKNANLTAAIRRYQIRNGLQINGELNSETLRSIGIGSSAPAQPAAKVTPSPRAAPQESDESSRESAGVAPAPVQPFANPSQNRQVAPSNPIIPRPPGSEFFTGTPYESAPLGVQRNVLVSAQIALARGGFYRGEIDGMYSPAIELSLRAYQSRTGLPVTGRFDLGTLAALKLLPRAHAPMFNPYRQRVPGRPEPPVRGEWIPE